MGRAPIPKRGSTQVGYDPDALGAAFEAARKAGGGIQANAHPELSGGTRLGNPLNAARGAAKKIGAGIAGLFRQRDATPAEEASYKHAGQMAYWNAKAKKDFQK